MQTWHPVKFAWVVFFLMWFSSCRAVLAGLAFVRRKSLTRFQFCSFSVQSKHNKHTVNPSTETWRKQKPTEIYNQKHDGNVNWRFRSGNTTETWKMQRWFVSRVSASRKRIGNKEVYVSATFQKYGNAQFRPVKPSIWKVFRVMFLICKLPNWQLRQCSSDWESCNVSKEAV